MRTNDIRPTAPSEILHDDPQSPFPSDKGTEVSSDMRGVAIGEKSDLGLDLGDLYAWETEQEDYKLCIYNVEDDPQRTLTICTVLED
jgi:hypothetical protein